MALLVTGLALGWFVQSGLNLFTLKNASGLNLEVSIKLRYGSPVWQGHLSPGQTTSAIGFAKGDTDIKIRCRTAGASEAMSEMGYLTGGINDHVMLTMKSCSDIGYRRKPLIF